MIDIWRQNRLLYYQKHLLKGDFYLCTCTYVSYNKCLNNMLMRYTANFSGCENDNFQFKCLVFNLFLSKNIDSE